MSGGSSNEVIFEVILEVILEVISEVIFEVNLAGARGSPFSVFNRRVCQKSKLGWLG